MNERPPSEAGEAKEEDEPDHGPARELFAELAARVGLKNVIYVDDGNPGDGAPKADLDAIVVALTSGRMTPGLLASNEATAAWVHNSDGDLRTVDELTGRLTLQPPDASDEQLVALTDVARLARLTADGGPATQQPGPSKAAQDLEAFHELRQLMPESVRYDAINLAAWYSARSEWLAVAEPTLILFDRDFSMEGASTTAGDTELALLANSENQQLFTGMLTHGAADDTAEREQMAEIAVETGSSTARTIVISKRTINERPELLVSKVKVAFLGRSLDQLRASIASRYQDAHKLGAETIKSFDGYVLSELVRSAEHEGAHGSHNILRVGAAAARRHLEVEIGSDSDITRLLKQIREIHQTPPAEADLPPTDISTLRYSERYDDASHLSKSNRPIEPGDIFEKVEPNVVVNGANPKQPGRRYVLVSQECDTMVRSDGTRVSGLITFKLATLKQVLRHSIRRYDHVLDWYDATDNTDHLWCVLAWDCIQVPINAVDACSLSQTGGAVVEVGGPVPKNLTPGWELRFQQLQKWAATALENHAILTGDKVISDTKMKSLLLQAATGTTPALSPISAGLNAKAKKVGFGLRRIGHVSDADVRAVLVNAGDYSSRPAGEGSLFLEKPDT